MATRAIIAKVDRRGDGLSVHLRHDGSADAAGATLLQHCQEEGIRRPADPEGKRHPAGTHAGAFDRLRLRLRQDLGNPPAPRVQRRNRGVLRPLLGRGPRVALRLDP